MGWEAYYRDGTVVREEDGAGRPVIDGDEGKIAIIAQRDYGHYIGVDLDHGIIFVDLEKIEFQGEWYFVNFKSYFWITEETNTVGAMQFIRRLTEPDEQGWVDQEIYSPKWRPIWFTRFTNGDPTKVIGCQTTLPDENGVPGKNVKKLVCLFSDGRLGIN
jgi:hypothetical protein